MKFLYNALILLVLFAVSLPASAIANNFIEAIGGAETIQVKRGAQSVKLKAGDAIQVGDEIATDGKTAVDIRLEDQTIIRVGVNSIYRLQENSKMKKFFHELFSGIVRVFVPPAKSKNGEVKFRLNTPEGTIGVRGTEFVVIRDKDTGETKLKGLSGEVLFGSENVDFDKPSTYVLVRMGYESSIRQNDEKPASAKTYSMPDYLKDLDRKDGFGHFGPMAKQRSAVKKSGALASIAGKGSMNIGGGDDSDKDKKADQAATGKDTKAEKVDGNKMLQSAIAHGEFDKIVAAVKKHNADVNFQDEYDNSPLHMVVATGELASSKKLEAIEFLLANKAKVNSQNINGHTPLMLAAMETEDAEVMKLLLKHNADSYLKDIKGKTALDLAKDRQKSAMVELLEQQ